MNSEERAVMRFWRVGRTLPLALFLPLAGALLPNIAGAAGNEHSAVDNEAVHVHRETGRRTVDLPPGSGPGGSRLSHMGFADPYGHLYMIETTEGLVECAQRIYRADECRPSRIGQDKRRRTWVVKRQGKWLQCERPARNAVCGGIDDLFLNSKPLY